MTGVCRWVDIRTGTYDMAAVCAGGVAGVALTVADLCLRIEHRGAAAVVTACIDRLKEESAAAGGTHGAELWDRAAPLKGGAVGHQIEHGLRLVGIPIFMDRCCAVRHVVFAEILHLPAAPAMGNHDEFFAAGYFALFGVGIVGFNDELLHRLGRAADVEGILIDTAEAGAVPVPAVIMDMALRRNGIVADGTSEHIDFAAAYRVKASVKHKGMREDALLGAGGHIMRFVIACFKQARKLVAVAFRVIAYGSFCSAPVRVYMPNIVSRCSLAVVCEALISTPTLKSGNRPYSMNIK